MLVVFIRTLILYAVVIVVMRLMGKRQIGELQPFELVVAILISDLAAVPMQNTGIPLVNGIIPIFTLLIAQLAMSLISLKSVKARGIICGKPSILIEKGKINESVLRREMYTINDLLEQLRSKDIYNIADVEYAILETNGQLSVLPKAQKRPLTLQDMNIPAQYEGLPLVLINDGYVSKKDLDKAGVDENWLKSELAKHGISDARDVLFASLDPSGNLFLQRKER
ncbi:DUF421 domain-containing protein [Pseudoclostridium thermosuccinogenes]|uniref:DUF421 domain-containing protein n=1 Tax=Clostridium thermosuccinogenes TaxID=84032 RepID=UPI002FD8F775